MFVKLIKWVLLIGAITVGGVFALGGYYWLEVLPSLHEPPLRVVNKLPPGFDNNKGHLPAYSGLHPSLLARPKETFPFPIRLGEVGPIEPLFAGELSYPLWCGKNKITAEQPLVDNLDGYGVPVFGMENDELVVSDVIGYSQDCTHPTRAKYYYLSQKDQRFYPLEDRQHPIEKIVLDGRALDFVVRVEAGTINRHFYVIAVLRGMNETLDRPDGSYWNQKLIYQFRGGVGIGKRQGNIKSSDVLRRRKQQLKEGYAVVYSSANQTSNHYNMWLAEDTALRVKRQFSGLYGAPDYTVGIGGSGGAIQQFLLAQNNSTLLDAIIPLYSYPDMVSQTIYVLDCEPLEYFFDVVDQENSRWNSWHRRVAVEGLSASESATNPFAIMTKAAGVLGGSFASLGSGFGGASECVQSWRGLTPLIHNPTFVHFANNFSKEVQAKVHWTHWEDLSQFYGRDENGYAQSTWDNVGVQYGLAALVDGDLNLEEFLKLNRKVGGWIKPDDMEPEKLWVLQGDMFPIDLSFWSHHNQSLSVSPETPAQRTHASVDAIGGAYKSGHVFLGKLSIPILDVRHYLDDELDMHHSSASFMTRSRMIRAQNNADNHIIWMSNAEHNPVDRAFAVMDEWLMTLSTNPSQGAVAARPPSAQDTCFDGEGQIIAKGQNVWDGEWNGRASGDCMSVYPSYKTSREIAGGPVSGDVFKCQRQSVTAAISAGVYGNLDMWPYLEELEVIFPDGVCDYRLADLGRPRDLLQPSERVPGVAPVRAIASEIVTKEESMTLSGLEATGPGG